MTYASVVFAHAARTHIDTLQSLQSRFCRLAVGAPWFVRNVDLHDDLGLESIRKHMKSVSERYFDKAMRHDNRLIVAAADYSPNPDHAGASHRRRPRHVLTDPSDPITFALDAFSSNTRSRLRDFGNRTRRTRQRVRRAT